MNGLSIGEVSRRLTEGQIPTQTGKTVWDRCDMGNASNPAYMGKATFGKTKVGKLQSRIRPPKHSAQTPKKAHSVSRTDRDTWIEISVPSIISETLFQAVRHQLDENRKRAHIVKRGVSYLLQGLTVCGHCHYAYYGKKISPIAAKGNRQYAYYRCIGSDAYRFGGQRICDNKQVRTQRPDDVVWGQILNAVRDPKRLKKEYENGLKKMQGEAQELFDTGALKNQKAQLEKSKSRLIDSYIRSIIDKGDFEPKIKTLKFKLNQIKEKIDKSTGTENAQYELFLIIDRLEDFARKIAEIFLIVALRFDLVDTSICHKSEDR